MNALVKPITVQVIDTPLSRYTYAASLHSFISLNRTALAEYWLEGLEGDEWSAAEDKIGSNEYVHFCASQFDLFHLEWEQEQ